MTSPVIGWHRFGARLGAAHTCPEHRRSPGARLRQGTGALPWVGAQALAGGVHGRSDPQGLVGSLQGHKVALPPTFTSWVGAGGAVTAGTVNYHPVGPSQER